MLGLVQKLSQAFSYHIWTLTKVAHLSIYLTYPLKKDWLRSLTPFEVKKRSPRNHRRWHNFRVFHANPSRHHSTIWATESDDMRRVVLVLKCYHQVEIVHHSVFDFKVLIGSIKCALAEIPMFCINYHTSEFLCQCFALKTWGVVKGKNVSFISSIKENRPTEFFVKMVVVNYIPELYSFCLVTKKVKLWFIPLNSRSRMPRPSEPGQVSLPNRQALNYS